MKRLKENLSLCPSIYSRGKQFLWTICLAAVLCMIFLQTGAAYAKINEAGSIKSKSQKQVTADNEEKLYMEYLAETEKQVQENEKQYGGKYYDPNSPGIRQYKIVDLNHDGKKELIFCPIYGDKPCGHICGIQNGKVVQLYDVWFWFDGVYTIKGSEGKIVAKEYEAANIINYTIFTFSSNGLEKQAVYTENHETVFEGKYKDHKKISEKEYQEFQNSLVEVKLDDYHQSVKKTKSARSDKEIYLEYLAKIEKKAWKVHLENLPDYLDKSALLNYNLIQYRIIDLNNDGKKELIYNMNVPGDYSAYTQMEGRICKIQNGKVKQIWKSDIVHHNAYYTLKGSKAKIVVRVQLTGGQHTLTVYHATSNKIKRSVSYNYSPVVREYKGGYLKNGKKLVKDPFGKNNKKLKMISMKEYKHSISG